MEKRVEMDFPIEIVERILIHCTGSQLCRSAGVSKKWNNAKSNIERIGHTFWRKCCRLEIESQVLDQINDCRNIGINDLSEERCKQIYVKWFRHRSINDKKNVTDFVDFTDNHFGDYEEIRALKTSGTLIISGHRSGRIRIIDPKNNVIIPVVRHMEPITDMVLIDFYGDGYYENHKDDAYPSEHPSYSSHSHMASISKDNVIRVTPICNPNQEKNCAFLIESIGRQFQSIRVCGHILAISAKPQNDISLFRLYNPFEKGDMKGDPNEGEVDVVMESVERKEKSRLSLKANLLKKVNCNEMFPEISNWFGAFTFSHMTLRCFCHESNVIAVCDVEKSMEVNKSGHSWDWTSAKELLISNSSVEVKTAFALLSVFAFGDGIIFIITTNNRVLYSTDSETFHCCPIHERLVTYDRIRTLDLFGSVFAYGTDSGYLFVEEIPTLKRLSYVTKYKVLFKGQICDDKIVKISISDDGFGPVVCAASQKKIFTYKWDQQPGDDDVLVVEQSSKAKPQKDIEVIELSDDESE